MTQTIPQEDIKAIECKHVFYSRHKYDKNTDMVFIKERIHLKDGNNVPNVRMVKNPQRTFYVTKQGQRTHQKKRLFESINNVNKYTTTQAKMSSDIAKAMGNPGFNPGLRQMAISPYLYGADVSIQAIIKYRYIDKNPDAITLNSVAVLDIETDVKTDNKVILSCALTFKNRAILAVYAPWVSEFDDVNGLVQEAAKQYLSDVPMDPDPERAKYGGDVWGRRKIKLEVVLCKTSGECAQRCIERAHQWQPDFIAIWNIDFDLPKILACMEADGINPEDVFSDPRVPKEYRKAEYTQGQSNKVTASGKKLNLAPAERWHTFDAPASFYFIDAMCVYRNIRLAKGLDTSYALDAILEKELGVRKLKFKEADHCSPGLEWHEYMQTHQKIAYLIYNLFDCISVEMLDEKEGDLSTTISILSKWNEYDIFPRQPKRTAQSLHFYALRHGKVIMTKPPVVAEEEDGLVTSTEGWIVTLPTHLNADNGAKCLKQYPEQSTLFRTHVYDQ